MSQIFKRILCPVDLSSFSLDALRLAVKIAETNDAMLDVLHVIHNPFDEIYMTGITQADPASMEGYTTEPQARAKILLKRFCREVISGHIQVSLSLYKTDG